MSVYPDMMPNAHNLAWLDERLSIFEASMKDDPLESEWEPSRAGFDRVFRYEYRGETVFKKDCQMLDEVNTALVLQP